VVGYFAQCCETRTESNSREDCICIDFSYGFTVVHHDTFGFFVSDKAQETVYIVPVASALSCEELVQYIQKRCLLCRLRATSFPR
jgi:hypothetical protein